MSVVPHRSNKTQQPKPAAPSPKSAPSLSDALAKVSALRDDALKSRAAERIAKIADKTASNPLDPVNVRLDASGIGEVKNLKAVEPWAFKLGILMQQGVPVPGANNLGNLSVTVAEGGTSGFDAWAEDTLVKGKSSEESERTAVLTVAGKDGSKLQLSLGVGIFHADQLARSGERRYGLYVESAELKRL